MLETKRLEIHRHVITRPVCAGGMSRHVYQGWMKLETTGEDVPRPVVIVTIGFNGFVEWIYTDEQYRRKGLATEALRVIESLQDGEFYLEGATESGRAFVAAYESGPVASSEPGADKSTTREEDMPTQKTKGETSPADEEIIEYHEAIGGRFGDMSPVEVVRLGVLKSACGWSNGLTCDNILEHHGLVTLRDGSASELTHAGVKYLWAAYKDHAKIVPKAEDPGSACEASPPDEDHDHQRDLKVASLVSEAYGCLCSNNTKDARNLLAACKRVLDL